MAEDSEPGADYPACTARCVKIVDTGTGATCGTQCSKQATPNHEAYGTHYCKDHA